MSTLPLQQDVNTTFRIEALKPLPMHGGQTFISDLSICASTQYAQHQLTQDFIKQVYEVSHKAKLSYFMPLLFSGFNAPDSAHSLNLDTQAVSPKAISPSVAIGLKPVTQSPVFLEQYLHAPIDVAIAEIAGQPVARERIVEIGNLASQSAGNARLMIAFLVFYLSASQTSSLVTASTKADWAVCTGTKAVRHILASMGIESHVVAKATIDALTSPEQQSAWGSYYDNNPLVLAIDVAKAKAVCAPHYNYTENASIETSFTETKFVDTDSTASYEDLYQDPQALITNAIEEIVSEATSPVVLQKPPLYNFVIAKHKQRAYA